MKTVFEDKIADLPDLAKTYLFKISFFDLQTAKYVDELELRAHRILSEKSEEELHEFYKKLRNGDFYNPIPEITEYKKATLPGIRRQFPEF